MKLTYIKQPGEPNGDAGDQYTGLDRFGRVVDQRWPQGSSELERVKYGFTPASNRQWRQELVASGQDQYYNYDGLYQVKAANQGTLNSGKTGIAGTPARTEDFTYDPIGNWTNYLTKVSGVTNLDQDRTQNSANQTTELDGSSATVAHDPAGNMTKVPQVNDWSATNELKWDAWNRLVEVKHGATTVARYAYDGVNRRVKKTVGGTTRRYYYSDQWQILEERLDSATTAERQFVWGLRYPDDLVLRIRGSERLYVLSDYFNPTAIADEAGTVLERYGYDTFGLSRVMTPSFAPRTSSNYDWETRFHAYRYDAETGLYQVRYRYLHPTLGRWPSRDPIEEAGGLNLYGMVDNNPVNHVDSDGRQIFPGYQPPPPRPPPNKPNDESYYNVHYSKNSITLNFHACCNCDELRDRLYADLKTFKNWGNNSVASLNVSGDIASFYPGLGRAAGGVLALNDPNWRVRLSNDDSTHCVSARTLDDHPLVGVRKWCASLSKQGTTCTVTITTEAYERPRNLANYWGGRMFGHNDQRQIWEDYFGNIASAYKDDSCFQSSQRGAPAQRDTGSTTNPWIP